MSDYDRFYRTLKALEPDAYRKAMQYAEGLALNHNLPEQLAAHVEISHVMLACELLGVKPQ